MSRHSALNALLSVFALVGFLLELAPEAQAEPEVSGDRNLLAALLDVQQTNLNAWTSGRLVATIVEEFPIQRERHEYTTSLVWDGKKIFCELSSKDLINGVSARSCDKEFFIRTPAEEMHYCPDINRFGRVVIPPRTRLTTPMALCPPAGWFYYRQRPWASMLDPKFGSTLKSVAVEKMDKTRVKVIRSGETYSTTIECDLAFGGNVVKYGGTVLSGAPTYHGEYGWSRVGTEIHPAFHRFEGQEGGTVIHRYEARVKSFEPQFRVTDVQFSEKAMPIVDGTHCYVTTSAGERHTVKGAEPPELERLRKLGQKLREREFLAPKINLPK